MENKNLANILREGEVPISLGTFWSTPELTMRLELIESIGKKRVYRPVIVKSEYPVIYNSN